MKLSEKEKQEFQNRYRSGQPIWQIAKEMKRCQKTVSKVLRDFGYNTKGRRIMDQDEYDNIVRRLERGEREIDIANELGRSANTVYTIRREIDKGEYRDYSQKKFRAFEPTQLPASEVAALMSGWTYPAGLKEHLAELRQ